jgi:3-oxoacyl-[acyl-carrier protein] reductase
MSEDIGGISLIGKRILITGASRGIGAAVALVVAKAGAEVIAHFGGHAAGAIENLKEISEDRKEFIQSDFSKPGSARELWAKATSGNKQRSGKSLFVS